MFLKNISVLKDTKDGDNKKIGENWREIAGKYILDWVQGFAV